jgi:hypothetical protein
MATYRVKDGERLPLNGVVHQAGSIVELPRELASDMAIAGLVQEVDATGHPVAPPPPDDLVRFKLHERVGLLRDRLVAAKDVVAHLEQQIADAEQALVAAVAAITHPSPAPAAKGDE